LAIWTLRYAYRYNRIYIILLLFTRKTVYFELDVHILCFFTEKKKVSFETPSTVDVDVWLDHTLSSVLGVVLLSFLQFESNVVNRCVEKNDYQRRSVYDTIRSFSKFEFSTLEICSNIVENILLCPFYACIEFSFVEYKNR